MSRKVTIVAQAPLWTSLGWSQKLPWLSWELERQIDETDKFSVQARLTTGLVEDWILRGLGRELRLYDRYGQLSWRGYVNELEGVIEGVKISVGPLANLANRIRVRYTDFTSQQATFTTSLDDTASQTGYGIRYLVVQVGTMSQTSAESVRATYLEESKDPEISESVEERDQANLALSAIGYEEMINYPYYNAASGAYTVREKEIDLIANEPNGIFPADYGSVEPNSLSVFRPETEFQPAKTLLDELVKLGGDSDNERRIYSLRPSLGFWIRKVPDQIKYVKRLKGIAVMNEGLADVLAIQPGEWMISTNRTALDMAKTDLRQDNRSRFIEKVSVDSQGNIDFSHGKTGTLAQKLAKFVASQEGYSNL